jgi:hypothetical protein
MDDQERCSLCRGPVSEREISSIEYWGDWAVGGRLAKMCERCGVFNGERCECGGQVVLELCGPGQALWVCDECDYCDIAFFSPPRSTD